MMGTNLRLKVLILLFNTVDLYLYSINWEQSDSLHSDNNLRVFKMSEWNKRSSWESLVLCLSLSGLLKDQRQKQQKVFPTLNPPFFPRKFLRKSTVILKTKT